MATPVIMPRQGQSVESCILVEWLVAEGATVAAGQPLANIETDKAVFEVESPAAGTLLARFFKAGDDIPVLTTIAALGQPGEDASALRPSGTTPVAPADAVATSATTAAPAPAAAGAVAATTAAGSAAAGISPRARNRAQSSGVDASGLAGSGPGGRVIERDVLAAAANQPRLTPLARAQAQPGAPLPTAGTGPGGRILAADLTTAVAATTAAVAAPKEETKPLSGIRKIIASRMRESLAGTAQLTLNRSFDASTLLAIRKKLKGSGERLGLPDITLNDMIVFAVSRALLRHPELNAHFLGDRIRQLGAANIGIAMDTPRGLMVPVLHNASALSLVEISKRIKPMAEAAQKGSVNPDLLQGGSFTITNMGMLGIDSFTPILNAPEVAILGVGGLMLKPVARGETVTHVQAINLSLTIDHQAVDGAPGARFLQTLAESLEQFELLTIAL